MTQLKAVSRTSLRDPGRDDGRLCADGPLAGAGPGICGQVVLQRLSRSEQVVGRPEGGQLVGARPLNGGVPTESSSPGDARRERDLNPIREECDEGQRSWYGDQQVVAQGIVEGHFGTYLSIALFDRNADGQPKPDAQGRGDQSGFARRPVLGRRRSMGRRLALC